MPHIAPSILSADFANLERDCRRVISPESALLHFDVMDGVFVPNLTVGPPVLASLAKALPEAVYDVHLMLIHPDALVEAFAKAGANAITIHCEAESPLRETLAHIRALGCKPGLSLRPATPVQELFPLLDEVNQVLVMSVEPGFGGQAFMPEAPGRISALKAEIDRRGLDVKIYVDGGINPETAPLCAAAGADVLVAGEAIFSADDPRVMLRRLGGQAG